jgi:hypothetical protein
MQEIQIPLTGLRVTYLHMYNQPYAAKLSQRFLCSFFLHTRLPNFQPLRSCLIASPLPHPATRATHRAGRSLLPDGILRAGPPAAGRPTTRRAPGPAAMWPGHSGHAIMIRIPPPLLGHVLVTLSTLTAPRSLARPLARPRPGPCPGHGSAVTSHGSRLVVTSLDGFTSPGHIPDPTAICIIRPCGHVLIGERDSLEPSQR